MKDKAYPSQIQHGREDWQKVALWSAVYNVWKALEKKQEGLMVEPPYLCVSILNIGCKSIHYPSDTKSFSTNLHDFRSHGSHNGRVNADPVV